MTPLPDGTFQLLDGNHRYEAALTLGLSAVPCIVKTTLNSSERYRLAWQSNQAALTVVASTLVTYAEFIWARLAETDARGKLLYTHEDIARMLGWSHSTVSNYALLAKIDPQAWTVISTTFEPSAIEEQESVVEEISTTVEMPSTSPFTERVLRCILPLLPEQQRELVGKLAHSRDFSKGKFKVLAENYRALCGPVRDLGAAMAASLAFWGQRLCLYLGPLAFVSANRAGESWTACQGHHRLA